MHINQSAWPPRSIQCESIIELYNGVEVREGAPGIRWIGQYLVPVWSTIIDISVEDTLENRMTGARTHK